jgi:hypothetical protein
MFKQLYTVKWYCKGKASLSIIPLCFVYFCDDVPDDSRTANTCCMIK